MTLRACSKASMSFCRTSKKPASSWEPATSILRSIHCHGSFPSLSSSAVRKAQSPNAAKIAFMLLRSPFSPSIPSGQATVSTLASCTSSFVEPTFRTALNMAMRAPASPRPASAARKRFATASTVRSFCSASGRHSELSQAVGSYSTYQPLVGCARIAHEQQDQDHTDEWNEPCDDYDGVKGMRAGGLARIGKLPDQFECDDSPDSRPCSAQAADRSNGIAPIEIGRQHVCDRRKRCVGKGGEPEKQRNQVQIHRENCRNKKQYAEASKDDQRFSRRTEWPAAPDQVAGNSTAEEIAQVRGKKGNPHCHQAALERNAFCDQVDGKPVRDKEPHGIGKALGDDRSPSLGQLQKVAPSQPRFSIGLSFLGLGKNHPALGAADARMILRQVIHFSPDDQPQESEHSWNDKGDA